MSEDVESPISNPKTSSILQELMNTEKGRELAEKIRVKLNELNVKFAQLSPTDKKKFKSEFKNKFSESLQFLKNKIQNEDEDGQFRIHLEEEGIQPHILPSYMYFYIAFLLLLSLFG
jgi:hypothetical protein